MIISHCLFWVKVAASLNDNIIYGCNGGCIGVSAAHGSSTCNVSGNCCSVEIYGCCCRSRTSSLGVATGFAAISEVVPVTESGVEASASSPLDPPPPPPLPPLCSEEPKESAKEALDSEAGRLWFIDVFVILSSIKPNRFSPPPAPAPPPEIAAAKLWRTNPEAAVAKEEGRSSGDSGSGVYLKGEKIGGIRILRQLID